MVFLALLGLAAGFYGWRIILAPLGRVLRVSETLDCPRENIRQIECTHSQNDARLDQPGDHQTGDLTTGSSLFALSDAVGKSIPVEPAIPDSRNPDAAAQQQKHLKPRA
jgi:hypothetical protein